MNKNTPTTEEIIRIAAQTGAEFGVRAAMRLIDGHSGNAIKALVNSVVASASKASANAIIGEQVKTRKKEAAREIDRRLYNTRLLLRNYNSLKAHCENAIYEAISETDEPRPGEIWELLNRSSNTDEIYIDSIKRSAMRTMIIIQHIDRMLDLYAAYCDKSPQQAVKRQYRVLQARYLSDPTESTYAIAEREHIHPRTVDKDLDVAVEAVTALLFGIDAIGYGSERG